MSLKNEVFSKASERIPSVVVRSYSMNMSDCECNRPYCIRTYVVDSLNLRRLINVIKKEKCVKQYFPSDLVYHAISLIPNTELRIDLASIDVLA